MESAAQSGTGSSVSDLVRRIAAGDRSAEGELIELYSRGVTYLLRHLTGDRQVTEDLHQETFRIVLLKVRNGELREPEKLSGFVRGTARNLSRAEFRKTSRLADPADDHGERVDPAPGPLGEVLRQEERKLVRQVLSELRSERDRQVLFRFHIAEEEKEEICKVLELTSRQFNLVLFRAHQRFRKLLEKTERRLRLAGGISPKPGDAVRGESSAAARGVKS